MQIFLYGQLVVSFCYGQELDNQNDFWASFTQPSLIFAFVPMLHNQSFSVTFFFFFKFSFFLIIIEEQHGECFLQKSYIQDLFKSMQCSRDHDNLTNNNLHLFKYIQSLYLASTGIQPCFTCFLLFKNTRVTPWFCLHHQQGDMIASCDSRGVLKLWDIRQSVPIMSVDAGPRPANQAAFDYSGRNFYQLFFYVRLILL